MIRLFRVFVPVATLTLLVSEILLIISVFVLTTYAFLEFDPTVYLLYERGLVRILLVVLSFLVGLHLQDLYSQVLVKSRVALMQQLSLVVGSAFLLQGTLSYVDSDLKLPLPIMLWGASLTVAAIYSWRVFFSAYALRVVGRDRLLLVGNSPLLEDIGAYTEEHPEAGIRVAGYIRECGSDDALPGGKILGPIASLRDIVQATQPRRIVVGLSERRNRAPLDDLLALRFSGYIVEEACSAYERIRGRICLKELRPSQLIYSGELGPRPQHVLYQNLVNVTLAVTGIAVSLPLMLLTALAIRLSSPGPVLYRQTRVGMNDVPFTLYKFRSMRVDAEAGTGPVWASRHDPRVTPVGRVIRKLRLDELPQLFNVLKGEMSLVGPRPERPEFVQALAEQIPYYNQRHFVRPGITGWAQINHKYGDTIEDTIAKLEYDLYYIKNMSVGLDTYIVFHTLKAMLLSRGAQ
ncbi:MAG: sugar transferase [Acidobacteriia bacterium]|nr:sugar transferase [Terriglobia bacterium]